MFVFGREDLPADPVFPAELDKLGSVQVQPFSSGARELTRLSKSSYFINESDQIRKISDPSQEFQFKINKNERWNQVQRGAMNGKYPLAYRTALPLRISRYRVELDAAC